MRNLLVGLILLAGLGVGAHAAEPLARKEADFTIPNYRFRSGETIPELRIHYVTLGTPQRDASGHVNNAVLLLHGTTSNAQFFLGPNASGGNLYAELLAEGHPLDATRYYVIIPDAIGHGKSSKPSDGSHAKFPRYGYEDIVDAEYRLIVEGLGVDHLTLVLGTSMGGSLSWLWGERHPDFVDKLVPIASAPVQIAGRNYIFRRLLTEAIRTDPEWNEGNYQSQPTHWRSVLPLYEVMFLPAPRTQSKWLIPLSQVSPYVV
jgi:homoserine O-acetyltransferase